MCVLWAAVRLPQQPTLLVGAKQWQLLCRRMDETARRNTQTGDVLLN